MKTIALTGGASGIGAAIKQHLLDAGHTLIVLDIKNADIEADLSSAEGRDAAISALREAAPDGLDALVLCAGVGPQVPDKSIIPAVNYFGTVQLTDGLRDLLVSKRGSVVFISSNSAPMCNSPAYMDALLDGDVDKALDMASTLDGQELYSGSKQAVARWLRRNTQPYALDGVRMNAVAPGYIETPLTAAGKDDPEFGQAIRDFVASIPVGRPGQPDDIANMVDFLLSDAAEFVCGSVLFVDGGHDAMLRPDAF